MLRGLHLRPWMQETITVSLSHCHYANKVKPQKKGRQFPILQITAAATVHQLHRLNWSDSGETSEHSLYARKALWVYFPAKFTVCNSDIPRESYGSLSTRRSECTKSTSCVCSWPLEPLASRRHSLSTLKANMVYVFTPGTSEKARNFGSVIYRSPLFQIETQGLDHINQ